MNKNQLKIAFTWPGNTGKSTIIQKLAEDLSYSISDSGIEWNEMSNNNRWCKPKTVSVYPETARKVLDDKWFGSMSQFQQNISALEDERLKEIAKDTADILLIDRTCMDGLVYSIFNLDQWFPIRMNQESKGDYDLVILFTEEFKKTQTEQFEHYNDGSLVELFRNIMKFLYGDKVYEFKNWGDITEIKKLIH